MEDCTLFLKKVRPWLDEVVVQKYNKQNFEAIWEEWMRNVKIISKTADHINFLEK